MSFAVCYLCPSDAFKQTLLCILLSAFTAMCISIEFRDPFLGITSYEVVLWFESVARKWYMIWSVRKIYVHFAIRSSTQKAHLL